MESSPFLSTRFLDANRVHPRIRSESMLRLKTLRPIRAAAAVGAEVKATRAGMRGGVGVVLPAAAIGAAMPAGAAAAGDRNHVAVGCRCNGGERQRIGAADEGTKDEGGSDQSVHEASPDGLIEIVRCP